MKFEIIKRFANSENPAFELVLDGWKRCRIYAVDSAAPYIMLDMDGEKDKLMYLLPEMKKELKRILRGEEKEKWQYRKKLQNRYHIFNTMPNRELKRLN